MKRILLQFPPRFSLAPRGFGKFVNPKGYPAVYSWIGGTDTGSDSIATNGCRIFVRVDDLEKALRFYRDLLGHPVERVSDRWADLAPARGLTLTLEDEGPVEFHVDNFEEAAERLETAGVPVERRDRHGGKVRDPSGNVIGLHDHRE